MIILMNNYSNIVNIYTKSKKELKSLIESENILNEYNLFKKNNTKKFSNPYKLFLLKRSISSSMKREIDELYNSGYGIKSIAKEINLSYTTTRHFLSKICDIELRMGRNVVTSKLKESRKNKAIEDRKNKNGWFNDEIRSNLKIKAKTQRGVQGWYFNKSMQKWVWLRSTYEYIFAKWLDRNNYIWDNEVKCYSLQNETYRPDFFIYDEKMNITKIIEIKGYYDNRAYKPELLNQIVDIDICLIRLTNENIKKYLEKNLTYGLELKNWKIIRKQNENKKN